VSSPEAYFARSSKGDGFANTLVLRTYIEILDELGDPMKQQPVKLTIDGGRELSLVTDDLGRVYPGLPEDANIEVFVGDVHEAATGDSTATDSGKHFAARKDYHR
jgi:hypothetical protein